MFGLLALFCVCAYSQSVPSSYPDGMPSEYIPHYNAMYTFLLENLSFTSNTRAVRNYCDQMFTRGYIRFFLATAFQVALRDAAEAVYLYFVANNLLGGNPPTATSFATAVGAQVEVALAAACNVAGDPHTCVDGPLCEIDCQGAVHTRPSGLANEYCCPAPLPSGLCGTDPTVAELVVFEYDLADDEYAPIVVCIGGWLSNPPASGAQTLTIVRHQGQSISTYSDRAYTCTIGATTAADRFPDFECRDNNGVVKLKHQECTSFCFAPGENDSCSPPAAGPLVFAFTSALRTIPQCDPVNCFTCRFCFHNKNLFCFFSLSL